MKKLKFISIGIIIVIILLITIFSIIIKLEQTIPKEWNEIKTLSKRDEILLWNKKYNKEIIGEYHDMNDLKAFDIWTIEKSNGYIQLQINYDNNKVKNIYISYTGKQIGLYNKNVKVNKNSVNSMSLEENK